MGIYDTGKYAEVHPTFLYESICTFFIFIILTIKSNNRKYKGEITLIYLMLYSLSRMFIETLRTDSLMLGPFRISQVLSIIILVISIINMSYFRKFGKTKRQNKIKVKHML